MSPSGLPANLPISHHWQPLTDLPEDWMRFARADLDELLRAWAAQRMSARWQSSCF